MLLAVQTGDGDDNEDLRTGYVRGLDGSNQNIAVALSKDEGNQWACVDSKD